MNLAEEFHGAIVVFVVEDTERGKEDRGGQFRERTVSRVIANEIGNTRFIENRFVEANAGVVLVHVDLSHRPFIAFAINK